MAIPLPNLVKLVSIVGSIKLINFAPYELSFL